MLELKKHFPERISHVIFDWNGTLLNDIDLAVEAICELLANHALPPITREHYRKHFRFPVIDYYRGLGFNFSKTPFDIIAHEFIEIYNSKVRACPLFEGAKELLLDLKGSGLGLSVLSAAEQGDLDFVLKHHEIHHHFENVFGIQDRLAVSKVARGKQLLAKLEVPSSQIVLIGDTDHDAEVARELGVSILLLGDGHQCADRLFQNFPHVIRSRF